MTSPELRDIIDRALASFSDEREPMTFAKDAASKLIRSAAGFPWFVHVIGQAALLAAADDGQTVVNSVHVDAAVSDLARNRFVQSFRDSYQKSVRDSSQREIVLRLFAQWRGTDIPTSEIYASARKLGVSNPAVYKGHLCSDHFGAPLMTPGFQERGLVRFRNEMFKQYINLARSLYVGIRDKVNGEADTWSA
jgi:hypothetical protein